MGERELEAVILRLLAERGAGKTICPSDAARAVGGNWRALIEQVREAARRLVARGKIDITQKGQAVDGSIAKGPIRFRLSCADGER
jgi:hypothetical protein